MPLVWRCAPHHAQYQRSTHRPPARTCAYIHLHAYLCQGTAYHGLQMATQANIPTVEAEVHKALHLAGAISDANYGDRNKVKWSSASRTDKGVHAAACVCTVKLLLAASALPDDGVVPRVILDSWNAHLPADIRILAALRAPKNGRAHALCSLREYECLVQLPTYTPLALCPACTTLSYDPMPCILYGHLCHYRYEYLVPEAALHGKPAADLRRLLKNFEGTHRFHNFAGRLSQPKRGKAGSEEEGESALEEEDEAGDSSGIDAADEEGPGTSHTASASGASHKASDEGVGVRERALPVGAKRGAAAAGLDEECVRVGAGGGMHDVGAEWREIASVNPVGKKPAGSRGRRDKAGRGEHACKQEKRAGDWTCPKVCICVRERGVCVCVVCVCVCT